MCAQIALCVTHFFLLLKLVEVSFSEIKSVLMASVNKLGGTSIRQISKFLMVEIEENLVHF